MRYSSEQGQQANRIVALTLASMRLCRRMSQRQLAEELGASQTFVSTIERGKRSVALIDVFTYTLALDSTPRAAYMAIKLALEEEGLLKWD